MARGTRRLGAWAALAACFWSAAASAQQTPVAPVPVVHSVSSIYVVRADHWTDADERGFGQFLAEIGDSDCHTVDACLHDVRNPFRASDPEGIYFRSDCADLPYDLRFYYAWKRGLPFAYESVMEPRGSGRDIRYTKSGNEVAERKTVWGGTQSGYEIMDELRDAISSASYRIHPDLEEPLEPDLYSPAIDAKSIRAGTMIYDPNGHVATVFRVDPDGRIHYIDAHPDNSLTRGVYDVRFVRSRPGMGAGFKNWRPIQLVGAARLADGTYSGGRVVPAANKDIADYSVEQFFGNGERPADDADWTRASFTLNGETLDYYDYVRAKLAGGKLQFDPLREVGDMVDSNCADLHYRIDAVALAIQAGLATRPEPERLPENIYGTDGDWETYSSPSRDARLKTAFKELRDMTERFVRMYQAGDPKLIYKGSDLVADLIEDYDRHAAQCTITYSRSDGSSFSFGYEDARKRLFAMSFDPYQCIERRWGALEGDEFGPCTEDTLKAAWYEAEQDLRNQIDRTYEARMDFSLEELKTPGPGKGVATAPDIDTRFYLISMRGARPPVPVAAIPAAPRR